MIAQTCPQLIVLQLSMCGRVTNRGVLSVLSNCDALQDLDISSTGIELTELLPQVTEMASAGIISSLKALDISSNVIDSYETMMNFIANGPDISVLTIDDDIAQLRPAFDNGSDTNSNSNGNNSSSNSISARDDAPLYSVVTSLRPKLLLSIRAREESVYETETEDEEEADDDDDVDAGEDHGGGGDEDDDSDDSDGDDDDDDDEPDDEEEGENENDGPADDNISLSA